MYKNSTHALRDFTRREFSPLRYWSRGDNFFRHGGFLGPQGASRPQKVSPRPPKLSLPGPPRSPNNIKMTPRIINNRHISLKQHDLKPQGQNNKKNVEFRMFFHRFGKGFRQQSTALTLQPPGLNPQSC